MGGIVPIPILLVKIDGEESMYIFTEKPHVSIVDISCGNILANDWEEVEGWKRKY